MAALVPVITVLATVGSTVASIVQSGRVGKGQEKQRREAENKARREKELEVERANRLRTRRAGGLGGSTILGGEDTGAQAEIGRNVLLGQ